MTLRDELARVEIFSAVPDKALDALIQSGTTIRRQPGGVLVEQGSPDSGFQFLRGGSARVLVNGVDRGELGVGDYFGEMSLIDGAPRSATVIAGPDGVETFAVSPLAFASLMDAHPQVARALLPVLTARIRAIESGHSADW